jgi:MinD-like ATPase involved in chromosome partitioning or flagellar assembly
VTVLAVCSASGGAGTTTTALALATTWPAADAVVLAELDQAGGDLAAWYDLARTPGVTSAAMGSREHTVDELLRHTQALPGGLRVLVGPVRSIEATASVNEAARVVLPALRTRVDAVVIADCGRVTPSYPSPVPSLAAITVVVVRQDRMSAPRTVGLLDHAVELVDGLRRVTTPVVVLIGAHPYPAREVEEHVGAELVGVISPDDIAAARLAGRLAGARSLSRSRLIRSSRPIAKALRTRLGSLVTPSDRPTVVAAPTVTPPPSNGHRDPQPAPPTRAGKRR